MMAHILTALYALMMLGSILAVAALLWSSAEGSQERRRQRHGTHGGR